MMSEVLLDPNDPEVRAFLQLPIGGTMEIYISKLTPTIPMDFTASYTGGLIEVYPLRQKSDGRVVIWIDDGNHRLFAAILQKATRIIVRKVIPDVDSDIRRFGDAERWHPYP